MAGVPGVPAAHVVVLGAGVVGTGALQMAVGLGARVTVLDTNVNRLRQLDLVFANRIATVCSNAHTIDEAVRDADVVIGAVLVPGASAPRLVTRDMIATMRTGAVVVDVAIDRRLLRDLACDDARGPDLRRRRRRALLRREHARRSRAHVDLRAEQRDPHPCARARRQGLEARR